MHPNQNLLLALAITWLTSISYGQAPVEPPAKLAEFRAAFEKTVATRSAPALNTITSGLEKLTRQRAASGDYEGAIRARNRRLDLLESKKAIDIASGENPNDEIVVDIASGTRSGSGLKYDANRKKMIGFNKTTQSIRWELTKTTPGIYTTIVTYSCGGTGGSFSVEEVTSLSTADSQPLSRVVTSTGGWEQPITRNIGKLNVTGSRLSLRLSVTAVKPAPPNPLEIAGVPAPAGSLMHLYSIRLVPVPRSQTSTSADQSELELSDLRSKYSKAIGTTIGQSILDYSNQLRTLRTSLQGADAEDAIREVQLEQKFIETLSQTPTSIIPPLETAASATSDAELTLLESSYRNELIDVRKDVGEKWLAALASLKDQLTREQKFAEAILVRSELTRVETMLEGDPLPSEDAVALQKIFLDPLEAKLETGESKMRITRDGKSVGYWSQPGTSVTWDIPPDIPAGTYELILHYQSGTGGGGKFTARAGDQPPLTAKITASLSGSWREKRSMLIGECELNQHTGTLVFQSVEHRDTDLMNVNGVDLAPQGTWANLQDSSGRKEHGFEKLEGARWIDNPKREPGVFTVKHKEKEYAFRPYYIQLPPSTEPESKSGKATLTRIVKQLRTTENRLLSFGKKVDSELRDAVWTEDLTIYTRWDDRGRGGAFYAFILVGEDPISMSLVEQGHARVGGSFATHVPFIDTKKKSNRLYLNQLRAAEKSSKQRRRGMWGL